MKIDSSPLISRTSPAEGKDAAARARRSDAPAQSGSAESPAAIAHLGRNSGAGNSQDIDLARVAEIRQAISEGRLEIRAERIADGLIRSVREMLDNPAD